MNRDERSGEVPENTGYKNDLGELERAFVAAYEAAMTAHFYVKMVWVGVDGDPGLKAGVAAVAAVIAERQRAQWSELVDQAPGAPKVFGVDYTLGEPIPVTAESLGLGDVLRDIATAGGPLRFKTAPVDTPAPELTYAVIRYRCDCHWVEWVPWGDGDQSWMPHYRPPNRRYDGEPYLTVADLEAVHGPLTALEVDNVEAVLAEVRSLKRAAGADREIIRDQRASLARRGAALQAFCRAAHGLDAAVAPGAPERQAYRAALAAFPASGHTVGGWPRIDV